MSVSTEAAPQTGSMVATGVEGLDDILGGGLTAHKLFLIEGVPGSGKTTLAMKFLMEARRGESVLLITMSETEQELRAVAASHGWSLDGIAIRELIPSEESLKPDEQYTIFHPLEVELGEATKTILAAVEKLHSSRVVFDSLSEMRLMLGTPLRYRRQVLALKQFLAGRGCTSLLLDDLTTTERDLQIQSIAHGVIELVHLSPEYGSIRRHLRVLKYRGQQFRGGYHDYVIERGGLKVFPRLHMNDHPALPSKEKFSSGLPELDLLLGGGLEGGTSTLLVGAAGTGKSSLAAQFATSAAERGQSAAMFIFDESLNTLLMRTAGLGIGLRAQLDSGRLTVQRVDPADLSPGEFAHDIRRAVECDHAALVVIDSLNGYLNAMPNERHLVIHLHEILTYLGNRGIATLVISAQHGLVGSQMTNPIDASYLTDAVILLRYFEARGEVRQAISIVKKRGSNHERTIRELKLTPGRIKVGEPLREFRGVLTGVPVLEGSSNSNKGL